MSLVTQSNDLPMIPYISDVLKAVGAGHREYAGLRSYLYAVACDTALRRHPLTQVTAYPSVNRRGQMTPEHVYLAQRPWAEAWHRALNQ